MQIGSRRPLPLAPSSSRPRARGPLLVLGAVRWVEYWALAICVDSKATLASVTRLRAVRYNFSPEDDAMDINDKAPEFTLPDENNDDVSLKDFRGKTVVLFFYPKADTPG